MIAVIGPWGVDWRGWRYWSRKRHRWMKTEQGATTFSKREDAESLALLLVAGDPDLLGHIEVVERHGHGA